MCTNTIHPFGIQCWGFKCGIQRIHLIGDYQSPKLSKVKFKFKLSGFKLFLPDSIPGSILSNARFVSETHSIIAMSHRGWIQESNSLVDSRTPRGDTTPGIPGSRPDFDRSHGRNTHLRSHERQFLVMNAKSDYLMVGWRHHSAIPS